MKILGPESYVLFDLLKSNRLNEREMIKKQSIRLKKIINFARLKSPFYEKFYSSLPENISDLSDLPPLTKLQVKAHFDEICTDRKIHFSEVKNFILDPKNIGKPYLGKYLISTTSGMTEPPCPFIADEFMVALGAAITKIKGGLSNWYGIPGILKFLYGGRRYALMDIDGGPFSGLATLEWHHHEHPSAMKNFKLISVLNNIENQVHELNTFKPTALGGYPSALLYLAMEQIAGRLKINPVFIILTGEITTSGLRRFIEKAFKCSCYEEYGSAENNVMAVQCKEGWLHYNSDWFVLEPVDKDYHPVKKGEYSHTVLVTNLANKVMPLIRYDQGDSVMLNESPCECGSVFPAMRIAGRSLDQLKLPNRKGGLITIQTLELMNIAEEVEGVVQAQLVHKSSNTIEFRLFILPLYETRLIWASLCERVHQYLKLNKVGEVRLKLSEQFPQQNKSGKFSMLIKEIRNKHKSDYVQELH